MKGPLFLSYFLDEETPVYGGVSGAISMEQIRSINKGDNSNNLKISLPNHSGTHIDFPRHFSSNGKTMNDYPPSFWIFNRIGFLECNVGDLPNKLNELDPDIELLILKSGFGAQRGTEDYCWKQPVIPARLAYLLREKFAKLRVFGFDMISLTSKLDRPEGKRAHEAFLIEEEILVLEDMDLSKLQSSPSIVIILPLQINQADGSPCTVIAY